MEHNSKKCIVIGEITTDKMVIVLNKIDQLSPDPTTRTKEIETAKTKLSKVFQQTKFKNAPFVAVAAAPHEKKDNNNASSEVTILP